MNEHAKALSDLATKGRKKIPKEKRIEIARKAARARWKKKKNLTKS
mgnify:CR=1 FL=1